MQKKEKKNMTSRLFLPPTEVSRPVFLCCDIQDCFIPFLANLPRAAFVARRFVDYCKLWNAAPPASGSGVQLRYVATEQYPKGLGRLLAECGHIDPTSGNAETPYPFVQIFEKTKFSMITPQVTAAIQDSRHFVLFGVEAHVCVLQTARDLLAAHPDNRVFVAADGTFSQREEDRVEAFATLRAAGACVSTSESLLLQLTDDASHPTFRGVNALLKQQAPKPVIIESGDE